jgi:hypothetical protein
MHAEAALDSQVLELHENDAQPLQEVPSTALAPTRAQIEELERHMLRLPQADIKVVHRFAPGLYMREITVPADCYMTGRVHKFEHVSVMVSGEMDTLVDGRMQRVSGYHPFIAPAGTKRVGHTLTEVVWLTVHLNPDELRDITAIEAMLCEPVQAVPALEAA